MDVYATFDELRSLSSEEQSQRLSHEAAAATGHGKRVLELREELTARPESLEELTRAGLEDAEDDSAKARHLESPAAAASWGAAREELLARLGEVEHSLKAATTAVVAERVHGDTGASAAGQRPPIEHGRRSRVPYAPQRARKVPRAMRSAKRTTRRRRTRAPPRRRCALRWEATSSRSPDAREGARARLAARVPV